MNNTSLGKFTADFRSEEFGASVNVEGEPNKHALNGIIQCCIEYVGNEPLKHPQLVPNKNFPNKNGDTPLHLAAALNPSPKVIEALMEADPRDMEHTDRFERETIIAISNP